MRHSSGGRPVIRRRTSLRLRRRFHTEGTSACWWGMEEGGGGTGTWGTQKRRRAHADRAKRELVWTARGKKKKYFSGSGRAARKRRKLGKGASPPRGEGASLSRGKSRARGKSDRLPRRGVGTVWTCSSTRRGEDFWERAVDPRRTCRSSRGPSGCP